MSALAAGPHSGADAVLSRVRADDGGRVSHQAVYDVLNTLTARGVVRRIKPTGSVARYELRVGDNHHHVVCRRCGAVTDVDCAVGPAPCLEPQDVRAHAPGFVLDEAEVTYWGTCDRCTHDSGNTDQEDA
jgi:Fur family ferric uptake transcriptional regulator